MGTTVIRLSLRLLANSRTDTDGLAANTKLVCHRHGNIVTTTSLSAQFCFDLCQPLFQSVQITYRPDIICQLFNTIKFREKFRAKNHESVFIFVKVMSKKNPQTFSGHSVLVAVQAGP